MVGSTSRVSEKEANGFMGSADTMREKEE